MTGGASESGSFAIVGMACVFPGAPDLATYWRNLESGFDAIEEVPASRWDPVFYDPASSAPDRFYCKRGGFVDAFARFDAAAFGVMPLAAQGSEPDQLLTLEVAARALADAGYGDNHRSFARDRTGIILGRGNYAGAGRTRLDQYVRTAEQLVTCLRALLPDLSEAELSRVKREFQGQIPGVGADGAIGLVPNLTASRIANRLDLHGPAFTIDAACASSLVAVEQACAHLLARRCDVMLCGGVHLCHDEAFWSVFCQLGALSRSQQIRPFDRRADGLLIGEGVGVVVLKRLADAERDDDRIYAVIRGTGVASDGREASLMTPRVEGQLLALERAWQVAGLDPASVGFVEAHGTGTRAGDAAEVATLERFFGRAEGQGAPRTPLGSVKSMIGHAMPAAGAAGLIKAALAAYHGVIPPSLHCEEPLEALARTRFRLATRAEPWDRGAGPRRAGINAFGFGGINAHVVIEEHSAPGRARAVVVAAEERLALHAAGSPDALLAAIDAGTESSVGACRLAIFDPTPERLARARTVVHKGRPWRGRDGIWFSPRPLLAGEAPGRIAFLFPGVDAAFEPHVDDVARRFGLPLPACTGARNLEEVGIGIIGVNRLLHQVLAQMGVSPDLIAGHSIGEWSAMIAAGVVPGPAVDELMATLQMGTLEVPGVVFAAAGCSVERAAAAIESLPDIGISHDNCPHQVIVCGQQTAVDLAVARLRADGVLCQILPFQSGFHSPLFAPYVDPHRAHFERLPLEPPDGGLWSATTVAPYPADLGALRALAVEHLVRPVRFRELTLALYQAGARVFVQVGTGSLVSFVEDTLRGHEHLALSANVKERSGLAQLRRLAAALFVEGAEVRWDGLVDRTPPARAGMALSLGAPLVRLEQPLQRRALVPALPAAGPLAAAFTAGLEEIGRAQAEVMASLAARMPSGGRSRPREASFTRILSLDSLPEIIDHTFFRQPAGWQNLSDRHPVIPMTTLIEIMMDAARAMVPERTVVGLENVRAFRWLVIAAPTEVRVSCQFDGASRVRVALGGYCEGTVLVGAQYPVAPPPDVAPLAGGVKAPLSARQLYDDRWMFHGPRFQGVVDLGVVGDDAIRGVLEAGSARGALLDNAGQLFGYWVMASSERDRMAMPVRIDRIQFHGPPPRKGDLLTCTVRIRRRAEREVVADMSLVGARQKVWATIDGWADRRFETDERLWQVMVHPETSLLAEPQPEGFVLFVDGYRLAPTRDHLARRFLGEQERAQYEQAGPRHQRAWLAGRVAAKDAVRAHLWKGGAGPIFPVEIRIDNEPSGRPVVRGAPGDLRLSLAHKDEVAVALVADGRDVGIDVERIEPRSDAFVSLAFANEELRVIGSDDRDEWLTRMWAAKEAVAKARGTGLGGDPRRFPVRDRLDERLLVDGAWVQTRRRGGLVIGWTPP